MSKGKTKKEIAKKNPLLEEDEEVTLAEDVEESDVEEEVEETQAPKKAVSKKKATPQAPAPKVDVASEFLSDIRKAKKDLEDQEQIHFMVPLAEGEKPGAIHSVTINGFKYEVPKGVMTTVPKAVAELLAQSYQIGMTAGADFRVDLNSNKQDALS